MTRWRLSGYPEPGLYPGAYACRFRLCHVRDDGLVALTVGDQRERGGRLSPVFGGFHWMTVIGRTAVGTTPVIATRELHPGDADIELEHMTLLLEWENREA